jgi:hypothetical protein
MRRTDDSKLPWILNVFMSHNSSECVNMIVRNLKEDGIVAKKDFEKKRKILESEVTAGAVAELKIDTLLKTIFEYENKLQEDKQSNTAQHLIQLYNKAVEYYSATNDMEAA